MAEPIPHEVRPLVRTHVYHPYQARTDRQRPIVVFNRRGRVFAPKRNNRETFPNISSQELPHSKRVSI